MVSTKTTTSVLTSALRCLWVRRRCRRLGIRFGVQYVFLFRGDYDGRPMQNVNVDARKSEEEEKRDAHRPTRLSRCTIMDVS